MHTICQYGQTLCDSQLITYSTQSYLLLYSFSATLMHLFIIWSTVLSISSHTFFYSPAYHLSIINTVQLSLFYSPALSFEHYQYCSVVSFLFSCVSLEHYQYGSVVSFLFSCISLEHYQYCSVVPFVSDVKMAINATEILPLRRLYFNPSLKASVSVPKISPVKTWLKHLKVGLCPL